ncbi:MAG: Electron transfer flavoprotein, beta subunit [Candidatus Carbobacillus altaicus]|uniref:Electron transfer flavoprotein small subunit n=1 Tax=Candidatus Carbonibacillus altaicus TaxID=2163959 RepID=A0A2R6XZZ0_9BACL|nr:MAG: Electron transfer flavoprotein, beta subunit [Candidatus Carbobacillus altaicus]
MHTLVLVKQVPDTKNAKLHPVTYTIDRSSTVNITNPSDLHAVEAAVRLKETYGGIVSSLSMGPPSAVETIRETIQMGVDHGFMISDRAFAGADTLATAYALSIAAQKIERTVSPLDLIITGKMTIDGDTGQVGPGVARRLGWYVLTNVVDIVEVQLKDRLMTVRRQNNSGYEVVRTPLPALLAVDPSINKPRRASMPNMVRAARYQPTIWSANDLEGVDRSKLGLKGSPTIVRKVFPPPKPEGGERVEGSLEDQVKFLTKILLERPEWIKTREKV